MQATPRLLYKDCKNEPVCKLKITWFEGTDKPQDDYCNICRILMGQPDPITPIQKDSDKAQEAAPQ